MKKRILAMILSCCMVVSVMGPVRAVPVMETEVEPARETAETEVGTLLTDLTDENEKVICISSENGAYTVWNGEAEAEAFLSETDETLPQLATPTGLTWHEKANGKKYLGHISWDATEHCEGAYGIEVFRDGVSVFYTNWSGLYDHNGLGRVSVNVFAQNMFNADGTYTFSVYAEGDGTNYRDSERATSEGYVFVCPSAVLDAPKNVAWSETGVVVHDAVEHAVGYYYSLYDQNGKVLGTTWNDFSYRESFDEDEEEETENERIEKDLAWYLREILSWERSKDVTGVYVTVRALTSNIETYQNGPASAPTETYPLSEVASWLSDSLNSTLERMENGMVTAEEALDDFLDYAERNDYGNTDLALSMETNAEFLNAIDTLDKAYSAEKGIDVSVKDTAKDSSYLESRGIDVADISVVGASLNSDGSDVSLNFSEADASYSQDMAAYKNSVAVNIDMDGTRHVGKLDVPIQITMPIPRGVLAERLVILHYHADGTVETIHPGIVTKQGTTYAVFVLASFSPFVFCNEEPSEIILGDLNGDGKVNVKDNMMLARYLAEWAGYDETTVDLAAADLNGDGKVNVKDNMILARHLAEWAGYETLPVTNS